MTLLALIAVRRLPNTHDGPSAGAIDGGVAAAAIVLPNLAPPVVVSRAARSGSVTFASTTLGWEEPYLIFLPPDYDAEPERRYPVLYMLHGMGGTYAEWHDYGLFAWAERLMENDALPPFLIVLPQGDYSYWVDHQDGPAWGTYVVRDLLAEIDGHYRTIPDAAHRAIGGLSMGGHGALQLALTHPGLFGIVGAHSPTLRRHDDAPAYFGDDAWFTAHDPVSLTRDYPEAARALTVFLDVGAGDVWLEAVTAYHDLLTKTGFAHVWRAFPGGHESGYWAANVVEYLRFYGAALAVADGGDIMEAPHEHGIVPEGR